MQQNQSSPCHNCELRHLIFLAPTIPLLNALIWNDLNQPGHHIHLLSKSMMQLKESRHLSQQIIKNQKAFCIFQAKNMKKKLPAVIGSYQPHINSSTRRAQAMNKRLIRLPTPNPRNMCRIVNFTWLQTPLPECM